MNKTRVLRTALWVVVFCFLLNVALFILSISVPMSLRGKAQKGEPFYFQNESVYWCKITDTVACGQYLYVLYEPKMIMECYDLEGNYQHSYLFEMSSKGEAQLYAVDGILYVESREHDLYTFIDAKFERYFSKDADGDAEQIEQLKSQNTLIQADSKGLYEIRRASIWEVGQDGSSRELVHRPAWLSLFQGHILFALHGVYLITIFALDRKMRKR